MPRQTSTNPGKYLDHETSIANGGVGSYSEGFLHSPADQLETNKLETAPAHRIMGKKDVPSLEQARDEQFEDRGTAKVALMNLSRDLFFKTGSSELTAKQISDLTSVATMMAKHPQWKLALVGHADPRGKGQANLDLSGRRAQSVKDALVAKGVEADRLAIHSAGEVPEMNHLKTQKLALDRNVEIRLMQ